MMMCVLFPNANPQTPILSHINGNKKNTNNKETP